MESTARVDVAVVGGGLAGLATAAYLARGGNRVRVLERSRDLGGRAATHDASGHSWNIGPHALYAGAEAVGVLAELGVSFSGGKPSASGGFAVKDGRKHRLPGGVLSLIATTLMPLAAKLELARALGSVSRTDADALASTTVAQWLVNSYRHADVRELIAALVRLTSYGNAPERMSAGAAVAQMKLAFAENVYYLDDGWQTLVEGLSRVATCAGAEIRTGARVTSVAAERGGYLLGLGDGDTIRAEAVILATAPAVASSLLSCGGAATLADWAESAVPVRAACLDLALSGLADASATFALGIDRPLYFSVHSAVARLAPAGAATVHAAKYLPCLGEADDPCAHEDELERFVDLVQPGWRRLVVERRFLPSMTVCEALPLAERGGMRGRPGPSVPGAEGVFVAGDWVGPRGLLADAALASARSAAGLCRQYLADARARAA